MADGADDRPRPDVRQLVHFVRFAPKEGDNGYALSRYKTQVATVYKTLEGRLSESKYLGGSEYSIADIATFPWARVFDMLLGEAAKPAHPHLVRWLAEIAQRPAVIKALAAVEDVRAKTSPADKVTSEQLDRMFGRGKFALA